VKHGGQIHRVGRFPRLENGERPLQLSDLETPAPLVDLDVLAQNLDRMATYTTLHGLSLRPHVKTHKASRVAAEQMERGAVGLTCATLREMEVMSDVSSDLLLAYPPVGDARLARLLSLPDSVSPMVSLDSAYAVEQLAIHSHAGDRQVRVCVEVDLGMKRVGVQSPSDAIELASLIRQRSPLTYVGIAFYPGHIRQPVGSQEAAVRRLQKDLAVYLEALDSAGFRPSIVSGGSTPAAWRMHEVGVTEVRPGTYVFNDRITVETGACSWQDCALTILATVVSTAVPDHAVVDAGSKSLGREPMGAGTNGGFGALYDRPEITVERMSEEHGILDLRASDWAPSVGDLVRIVPNHVCYVVNLHDIVYGVRGSNVETSWPVSARGR
jgi:D-serine deaminase-like pyridoxal phosphate-dependent protein